MPKQTPKPLPRTAGLTLLELLVTITILVVLSVAIGTVALNYLGRGKAEAARLQITQIETGLDLFLLDVGRYPTTQEGLDALLSAPSGAAEAWKGPYLRKSEALTDPWGSAFQYTSPGDHGDFDLYSFGSDRTQGGDDDAADVTNW